MDVGSDMKNRLAALNLDLTNSIVIGSGILEALGIRRSKDIDLVVKDNVYDTLKKTKQFKVTKNHGREILKDGIFEIGTEWEVLGKSFKFEDLVPKSEVIQGVRYNSLNFLLKVKKSWVRKDETPRLKDIKDIELIEKYLK